MSQMWEFIRICGSPKIHSLRLMRKHIFKSQTKGQIMTDPKEQNEYGPWIDWHGGLCPVDQKTTVEVINRSDERVIATASAFSWDDTTDARSIMAYRVKNETTMTDQYGPWIGWNGWNGGTPPDENTIVQVMGLRDAKPEQGKASHFNWGLSTAPIIVYRVKLVPEVRQWETNVVVVLNKNGNDIMVSYKKRSAWTAPVPISPQDDFQRLKITATQTGDDDPVFEIERVG